MVEEHEVSCVPGIPVTRTMDSPLQDNVVAPEAQGIHATIEVEDGGIEVGPSPKESSSAKSPASKNRPKSSLKMHPLTETPPRGFLDTIGALNETIPAIEELCIRQYSNARYWQFEPHLEPVRRAYY